MKNSPKLRFPEFVNEGEWDEKQISDICDKPYSGGTPSSTNKEFYGGSIPFIRSAEINKEKTELFLTDEGLKSSSAKLVKKGDVLIALYGANSGDVAISKIDGAINQAILCLNSKDSNPFLFQYFTLKKDWIVAKYIQGGQGNLSGEIVKSIQLDFPKPKEQQKIADCLSSLDGLISAQSQKVQLLKEHKKGLMQQLFPSEGESVPQLRFPEFENDVEWEEKKLGSFCSITTGKLDANAMVENGQYRFYTCAKNYYYIDNYAFDTEALLVSGNGANVGYIHYYSGKFNAYQRTYVLDCFSENIIFIKYSLEQNLHKRIATEKKEGNTPYIVMSTLTDMVILFPNQPNEQQKIADCLSSLDEQISQQTSKLQTLKEHKKGLMQQLFPNAHEK